MKCGLCRLHDLIVAITDQTELFQVADCLWQDPGVGFDQHHEPPEQHT